MNKLFMLFFLLSVDKFLFTSGTIAEKCNEKANYSLTEHTNRRALYTFYSFQATIKKFSNCHLVVLPSGIVMNLHYGIKAMI